MLKFTNWFAVVRFTALFSGIRPGPRSLQRKDRRRQVGETVQPGGVDRPSLADMNAVHDLDGDSGDRAGIGDPATD